MEVPKNKKIAHVGFFKPFHIHRVMPIADMKTPTPISFRVKLPQEIVLIGEDNNRITGWERP